MNKLLMILTLASAGLTIGCANLSPLVTSRAIPKTGVHLITYDSSRRGTLLSVNNDKVKSCAEPAPDTAYSFSNSFKASGKGGSTPAEVSVDVALTAMALQLAGRDNLVLLTREAMFRLCEAHVNEYITDTASYGSRFDKILEQISKIADTKTAEANATSATMNSLLGASIVAQTKATANPDRGEDK